MAAHCEDGERNIRLYLPEEPVHNPADLNVEEDYDYEAELEESQARLKESVTELLGQLEVAQKENRKLHLENNVQCKQIDRNVEEDYDHVAGLEESQARLKESVTELIGQLETAQEENIKLHLENNVQCKQIERMKENIQDAEKCCEALEELDSMLAKKDKSLALLQASFKKLEEEKRLLVEELDTISTEMSSMMAAQAADKKHISELIQAQRSLQVNLEEYQFKLIQTDQLIQKKDFEIDELTKTTKEYSAITQDLKNKIKEQEEEKQASLLYNVSIAEEMKDSLGEPEEAEQEDPEEERQEDQDVNFLEVANRAVWFSVSLLLLVFLGALMSFSSEGSCLHQIFTAIVTEFEPCFIVSRRETSPF